MLRDVGLCDVERGNETLRTPPSLNAICRGGSLLPSPPAPGATPRWRGPAVAPRGSLRRFARRRSGLGRYPVSRHTGQAGEDNGRHRRADNLGI